MSTETVNSAGRVEIPSRFETLSECLNHVDVSEVISDALGDRGGSVTFVYRKKTNSRPMEFAYLVQADA